MIFNCYFLKITLMIYILQINYLLYLFNTKEERNDI